MDATLYQPLFLAGVMLFAIGIGGRYLASAGYALQERWHDFMLPLAISVVLVLWIGMRPVSPAFGDTVNYAREYRLMGVTDVPMDWKGEWIWQLFMASCKNSGLSIHVFFTLVEAGYILSVLWAVKRFMPGNPGLGMLFVCASLMFFSFGTNGLRNGLACHIVLLAMGLLFADKYAAAAALSLLAFGIHRSVALPIAATLAGMYLLRNPKHAVYVWIASIGVSLVAGESITGFFASLGFDDRMTSYTDDTNDMEQFSRTGFRWDFLLYSAMPVLMVWYVCVRKAASDSWYNVIAVVYCLCNAFWVMVIRSSFSNRFAYLSWFLYPIVIAYPLINLPVWEDQDRKTGQILLAYCGFTLFMQFFVWS
ncbi:EpsG family protein [Bacteroides sp. AN502(2024)]|uniref:EpsG family protein n=1 Tax=Bacteroides sp. AN502(2024) TaxID=3160599 RepID=UPI003512374B